MGIPGLPPKDDENRIRRNAPIYEKIQVEWDGIVRGPELPNRWVQCECEGYAGQRHPDPMPPVYCGRWVKVDWHPMTLEWYEEWRRTPQSMVFVETDWQFFADTALLHDRYWSEGIKPSELVSLAAELRRREEAYGGTFESRRKLRMELKSPQHEKSEEAKITQEAKKAVDYVQKLTQEAARQKGE